MTAATPTLVPATPTAMPQSPPGGCDPDYPTDLDYGEITFRRFQVVGNDPHGFDGDNDGLGCER